VNLARVQRSDVSRLGKFSRTGAGAVRVPATISRTGIQVYGDLREYRPEDEVFAADSLASLGSVPVTLNHPSESVTPENVRDHQIGHVSDAPPEARVKVDGSDELWLRAPLVISDGKVLAEIDRTDAAPEVSCGYSCELDFTPGVTPSGEKYDAVQRNIRFNHVAILDRNSKARAGAEARLRLDGQAMKIKIDGQEFEYGSEAHINKLDADHKSAVKVATDRADKAEGALAAEKARADKAEAELTPAKIDARVSGRLNLLKSAAQFLPAEYETSGKSDSDIRKDAVVASYGAASVTDKSDAFVEGLFTGLTRTDAPAQFYAPKPGEVRTDVAVTNLDNDENFSAHLAKLAKGEGSK
jgi:hypothetical protein